MKSYTDIEQSEKLATILPIESADMYWLNRHIDLTETKYEIFVVDKSNKYVDFFKSYAVAVDNNEIIPCWSLTALLSVIPNPILTQFSKDKWNIAVFDEDNHFKEECFAQEPIDACYEMIVRLHLNKGDKQ